MEILAGLRPEKEVETAGGHCIGEDTGKAAMPAVWQSARNPYGRYAYIPLGAIVQSPPVLPDVSLTMLRTEPGQTKPP